ncbi:hypothetical protein [Alkalibacterium indicireducens]
MGSSREDYTKQVTNEQSGKKRKQARSIIQYKRYFNVDHSTDTDLPVLI